MNNENEKSKKENHFLLPQLINTGSRRDSDPRDKEQRKHNDIRKKFGSTKIKDDEYEKKETRIKMKITETEIKKREVEKQELEKLEKAEKRKIFRETRRRIEEGLWLVHTLPRQLTTLSCRVFLDNPVCDFTLIWLVRSDTGLSGLNNSLIISII